LVAARLGVEPAQAAALVRRGAVYVRGRRAMDPAVLAAAGDKVLVVLEESGRSVLAPEPPSAPWRVLYQDAALLAADKPAGLPAQATPGGTTGLGELVSAHLGRPAGRVHRLDRETTGVTLFGLTAASTAALAAAFRTGRVRKQYLAAPGPGVPEAGTVDLPLSRDPSRPGRWRASARAHGVPAVTDFRRLGGGEGFDLVVLWPRTGRTHQLRAHLTSLGAPILGDARYGGARTVGGHLVRRCLLHAHALQLPNPVTGAVLTLVAPVPGDLAHFFAAAAVPIPGGPLWAAEPA
jgi:23S rRNA pseudouridine1911/1915/1917 synthase